MGFLSPAQAVGYLALVLGITAFLQRSDKRLKFFNASQSLVYALHFILLGNFPATASSIISAIRSFLSLKFKSLYLAAVIIVINLGVGGAFVKSPAGWLPIIASCAATVAIFTLQGVPLRSVLLCCTMLWLANNIISRSIGGTVLELIIASINISTMIRLRRPASAELAPEA